MKRTHKGAEEMTHIRNKIMGAKSLDELCTALNEASEAIRQTNEISGLEKLSDHVDLSELPTYGGPTPNDTSEVFSWDDTRFLRSRAGLVSPAWELEPRDDLTR
jgi:hypothetical protein